jgi:hypothetical protein
VAVVYPNCDEIVARQAGVKAAVRAKGKQIEGEARALFAMHDHPGGASIEGEVAGNGKDYLVSLVDPGGNAVAIEFGRGGFTRKSDGRYIGPMEGLHVLGRAAGI